MATGTPLYPSAFDTTDTLGQISGIVAGSGGSHLGDSGPGQGTLLGITKNLINTMIAMQNVTGFPGTVLSTTHAFRLSTLETRLPFPPGNFRKFLMGIIPPVWDYVGYTTETTVDFTIPAVGSSSDLNIVGTTWTLVGQTVVLRDSPNDAFFQITGRTSDTLITVINYGAPSNSAPGTVLHHPTAVRLASQGVCVSGSSGLVPTPPGGTTTFLRGDATFASPSIKPWKTWTANDAFPASTLYGVWSVVNSIPFLAFNDSATWTSVFLGIVPQGAALGSGVIVRLKWASATATSGSVIWGVAIERCGNLTVVSDHFDTQVKATGPTNATVELFTETAITVTTINSMVAGDAFRLQIQRLGNDVSGNDTMVGDAQLFTVSIEGAA